MKSFEATINNSTFKTSDIPSDLKDNKNHEFKSNNF